MAEVRATCVINAEPARVFEFFCFPKNILAISDPAVGARLVDGPERVEDGSRLVVELVAFGTVQRTESEIAAWVEGTAFEERQVSGPLTAFRHRHEFLPDLGGTCVKDLIEFEPPGGLAGLLMSADKIAEQLEDNLSYRNDRLEDAVAAMS